MRTLYLSGHGVFMKVDNARLIIRDGCEHGRTQLIGHGLKPKYNEYDNIIVYGHSGNITLEAIKWLSRLNIQLTILDWDDGLVTSITIPEPKMEATRFAQYQAFNGGRTRGNGRKFIEAKIQSSGGVLDWIL